MRIKKNTDTHLSRCCQTSKLLLNIVILLFLAPLLCNTLYDLRQIAADFPAQLRTAVRHYIYSE